MGCNVGLFKSGESQTEEELEKRVLILGLDNAGKSSILYQIKDTEFKRMVPTIGLNVEQLKFKRFLITFWYTIYLVIFLRDVGGQATMLWRHYYTDTDAVIFVVDATNQDRVSSAKDELHKIVNEPQLEDCPLLIYANKIDLPLKMTEDQINKGLDLDSLKKKDKVLQFCSAKTNEGIWEGMEKLFSIVQTNLTSKNTGTTRSDGKSS
jgi:ADP-ribosylation factor 1/2